MPVSFCPSSVTPKSFGPLTIEVEVRTPAAFLSTINHGNGPKGDILQSSFPGTFSDIIPADNGFVHTVARAYNDHHALIIRPDDVWLAILVQFNFFVNGNAESLRSQFVAHKGKKHLKVKAVGTKYTVDFGEMAKAMTHQIKKNVVDPALRAWIIPNFSTTTNNDTIVCSIVMMATLKQFFSYEFGITCGIPQVTLDGNKKDWQNILQRLEKLKEYGLQCIAWYHQLFFVVSRFVEAFDDPTSATNIDFWSRVVKYDSGSGFTHLSGWITAFCVFGADGKWLGNEFIDNPKEIENPGSLPAHEFFKQYLQPPRPNNSKFLVFGGVMYHTIDTVSIPAGFAEVDVKLDDNGQISQCVLLSGLVGTKIRDSQQMKEGKLQGSGLRDVISPVVGWWMVEKPNSKAADGERDQEVKSLETQSVDTTLPGDNQPNTIPPVNNRLRAWLRNLVQKYRGCNCLSDVDSELKPSTYESAT